MQKETEEQEALIRGYQQVRSGIQPVAVREQKSLLTASRPRQLMALPLGVGVSNRGRRDVLQENEKLYLELKAEKCRSKATKDALLQENHSLLRQLAAFRWSRHSQPSSP